MQQFEYLNIGATELILSNGMRVCYKCTDFLDDQVNIGFLLSYMISRICFALSISFHSGPLGVCLCANFFFGWLGLDTLHEL